MVVEYQIFIIFFSEITHQSFGVFLDTNANESSEESSLPYIHHKYLTLYCLTRHRGNV